MHVRVEPYSPAWAAQFKAEATRIARALGDALLEVHHIGSTSVPGLAAKPVIDMMPVVRDLTSADARRESLEALGYEWCGEFGIPGRRYLRRSSPSNPDLRLFQLHVFSQDSVDDIRRHLAVRDYLRTHVDAARAYGALKERLARRFPEDIDAYCDGKDDFVQHLQHDAVAWMTGCVRSLPVIALRDRPDLIECAAEWFSSIWGIATEDYRASMRACVQGRTAIPQWYIVCDNGRIAAGVGVIDNDFHERRDLAPNVCAVYVQPEYRRLGVARRLLDTACHDMARRGVPHLYLLTDHDGFYERLGWQFTGMVRDDDGELGRMYARRMPDGCTE